MVNLKEHTIKVEIVRNEEFSDTTIVLNSELLHGLFNKLKDEQIDDLINRHLKNNKKCLTPVFKSLKKSADITHKLDPADGLWTREALKELVPEIKSFSKEVFASYLNPIKITSTLTVEEALA
jgi:hypothetical protein